MAGLPQSLLLQQEMPCSQPLCSQSTQTGVAIYLSTRHLCFWGWVTHPIKTPGRKSPYNSAE